MCWLQVDQPFLRPGESSCGGARAPSPCSVAQLLASRLRRIGDQLEKSWTPREGAVGPGCRNGEQALRSGRSCLFTICWGGFLRIAVRFTVLVLFGARPHL